MWLTREQVREVDRIAIEDFGLPGILLMENAARGAAELFLKLNPECRPTTIMCGPGNNGGDGFAMARFLSNAGCPVAVQFRGDPAKLPPDAALNLRILEKMGLLFPSKPDFITEWFIDALFGTGLTRPLTSPYSDIVFQMNASGLPIFAVDIPSGLDCDRGVPLGETIRASHTATFVAGKAGMQNPESRQWTGEVHVIDIGAPKMILDRFATTATS